VEEEQVSISEISFFIKERGRDIDVYLSGEIGTPRENVNLIEVLRSAATNDRINIFINSNGGNIATTIQIISILKKTDAEVFCRVEGECFSSAAMILMYAKSYEIEEHSTFMIHDYSGVISGHGGQMYDNMNHERKWTGNLIKDVYKNFLTAKEIDSILNGKEMWFDSTEFSRRMERKILRKKT
jgi:ATP-dependent protease ClpP protease subunit